MSPDSTRTTAAWHGRLILLGGLAGLLLMTTVGVLRAAEPKVAAQQNPFEGGHFTLHRGDVVALLGGADVATAQYAGHLEALLAAKYRSKSPRF
ncbi:MAG: hypothetical protein ABI651_19365, partial [Verrucomicrobiota bacterium]